MMSSVPYAPPDTMKNVAATRGHSVSFAISFFWEAARVGNWAGRDKLLNFLSRPPKAILALSQPRSRREFAFAEYGYLLAMQEKSAPPRSFFHSLLLPDALPRRCISIRCSASPHSLLPVIVRRSNSF